MDISPSAKCKLLKEQKYLPVVCCFGQSYFNYFKFYQIMFLIVRSCEKDKTERTKEKTEGNLNIGKCKSR